MAITPIDKPPVLRRFLTYDLEWVPGEALFELAQDKRSHQVVKERTDPLKHRLTGVFDGNQYRRYRTVDDFLLGEMTSGNRGAWFYAHAGGLADMGFVLDRIIANVGEDERYEVEASFSGSSAIIVHVKRGKNVWHFIDSYWLMRDSLRNIARFVGVKHEIAESFKNKDDARAFFTNATEAELGEKNEVDCTVLYKAVSEFETQLLEMGGQLQMTVASCALQLFRRKYLKRIIATDKGVNARAAEAYHASRVEVYERELDEDGERWDINSSFPYAMTFPCPGQCLGPVAGLPLGEGRLLLADVSVTVPESFLPPLPYRAHGRVFFPTGTWRGRYNNVDLELLLEEGGRVNRVYECLEFEPRTDLKEYAEDVYARRDRADPDSFARVFYKYIGNSLYGKFGESPFKSRVLINPEKIDRVGNPEEGTSPMEEYLPGVWRQDIRVPVKHAHVPISAHIVAVARRTLYRGQTKVRRLYYSDTDSIDGIGHIESGRGLGAFKHEASLAGAYYVAPKLYEYRAYWCFEHGDPDPATGKRKGKSALGRSCRDCGAVAEVKAVQRAKGFSEMDEVKFDLLVTGKEIPFQRMARLKELYGGNTTAPVEVLVEKAARGLTLPKRMFYPDGTTRPWHVGEIESGVWAERFEPPQTRVTPEREEDLPF